MKHLLVLVFLFLFLMWGPVAAQDIPPRQQFPVSTWNQIAPGGATTCGHGAPYSFYYREGPGEDLLIDFQGGGMCWNAQTCNISTTTFDDSINPGDPSDNPDLFPVGITNVYTEDNPFVNYDMVYVNYCTGDLHTGNTVVGYDYGGNWFETRHLGSVNATAVLNWVYNNFPDPDSVFVTGCSAGAVGAAYWANDIMQHYPNERVALLGDSGGGWRGGLGPTWNLWGTNYYGLTGDALSIEKFYITAAQNFPNNRVAEYNTAWDETQSFFHDVGFSAVEYEDALRLNLRDINNSVLNFRSYTQGGNLHCILPRTEFYDYATNQVRFRDWIADLAAGRRLNNIACTDCSKPELLFGK
ncbi:MAG TPA: pectin acetylesterase-family hydrolase [Phototrophicaceae bacterium]|nr:pectin acetylesterase-family hydrolase [Phototrophicaceae bacterium]